MRAQAQPSRAELIWWLARPYNLLLPAIAVVGGYAAAGSGAIRQLLVGLLALTAIHSGITIWNDIEDEAVDKANGNATISRLRGEGRLSGIRSAAYAFMGFGLILGIFLPPLTAGLLVSLVILGWAYNTTPFQASRRPLASMLVLALSYGLIPFALGASLGVNQAGWAVLLLGLGWMAGRASISLMKDYKDAHGDAQTGKKTFLLVYGARRTARLSLGLAAAGYAVCLTGCGLVSISLGLVAVGAAGAWLTYERWKLLAAHSYVEMDSVFRRCLHYQLFFDALVVAWLIIY